MRQSRLSGFPTLVFVIFLCSASSSAWAATLNIDQNDPACDDNVGTPFCTVQAAITAAAALDDIIEIAAGTYGENLLINNKDLTLQGAGRDQTILDGNQTDRVLSITGAGPHFITVSDLTVRNGRAALDGGGIAHDTVMPGGLIVLNCLITANQAGVDGSNLGNGGGIWVNNGGLLLSNTTISNNVAGPDPTDLGDGGGVWLSGSTFSFEVTFLDNEAAGSGGGLYVDTGDIIMGSARFEGNRAHFGDGGGLFSVGGMATIVGPSCLFSGNLAADDGGAISASPLELRDCVIESNQAEQTGGGIDSADVEIEDSLIRTNSAGLAGGGLKVSSARLLRSVVEGNTVSAGNGGGLRTIGGNVAFIDSLVSGNTAHEATMPGAEGFGGGVYAEGAGVELLNSTISGNQADASGGGLYVLDATSNVSMRFSTITANVADADANSSGTGGGLAVDGTTEARLKSTLLAGNSSGNQNPDCFSATTATLFTRGFNLIGELSADCALTPDPDLPPDPDADLVNVDPQLAALADNGGPTATHALLPTSPARDASDCVNASIAPGFGVDLTADQRGAARPELDGTDCDIGAFELQVSDLSITKADDTNNEAVVLGEDITYTIRVTNNGPADAFQVMMTDTLVAELSLVSAEASQGTCEAVDATISCNLGDINAGNSITVTIIATTEAVGSISNTATVAGPDADPDDSNNEATVDASQVALSDASVGGGCSLVRR